jgi:FkbM family methyltransferase
MRTQYHRNKVRTVLDIVRRIDNWPTAIGMRLNRRHTGLRALEFRDGLNVVCRAGSRDWPAIHELLFAGGYRRSLEFIRTADGPPTVLDLGGNIGLFSLLAARERPDATVHAFEPGPPNCRFFEMNILANPEVIGRIHLRREAVGGANATANWFLNEQTPSASSLYGTSGESFSVTIRAFSEIIASIGTPVTLAKIDIEGTEFDLVRGTPPAIWEKISAIELEIHDDPSGQMKRSQVLDRMKSFGYSIEEESICCYFLRR